MLSCKRKPGCFAVNVTLVVSWYTLKEDSMLSKIIHDRACGAIMGAFIGDALGPHWYYDLADLRHD